MNICGLNKTTLLDYPGRVAATVFLGGCNFRCPFCQNSSLILHPAEEVQYSPQEILSFLKKRRGILDGVCITGGEPTLSCELKRLIKEIKALGYPVKLDSNGSHPEVLSDLINEGLVDMIAMDIKTSPQEYSRVCGIPNVDIRAIEESAALLMQSNIEYEFRTTVVEELHKEKDFEEIASWLAGARQYYLQCYRDSDGVLLSGLSAPKPETLCRYRTILNATIPEVHIRGIET